MLYLHETHKVVGLKEDEFEAAYRDYWMPTMADERLRPVAVVHESRPRDRRVLQRGDDHRIEDGRAWEDLIQRVQKGDLQSWMLEVDNLRHDVVGKVLVPVHWSPLQEVDLGSVPIDGRLHEPSLFMEDTGWPYAPLDVYIQGWHDIYYEPLRKDVPEADARHPGVLPAGARHPSAARGDALAEDTRTGDPHATADDGAAARTTWRRDLHGRGARNPRPVGEQAPAHQHLVAAVLSVTHHEERL